jgi:uncharacterized protein (DUF885 family)
MLPFLGLACRSREAKAPDFRALRDEYFLGFLKFNPVTCTYLGGDGASADLAVTLRQLKDYSETGRHREMSFYRRIQNALDGMDPAKLSPDDAVDLAVIQAQTRFLLHQGRDRRYYQRALDTYVVEPFRGVDWQMQQMKDLGGGNLGTEAEWRALSARVAEIPSYLDTALENLREGVSAGNFPDHRMVEIDGIKGARSNAEYFRRKLIDQGRAYLSQQEYRDGILNDLAPRAIAAAAAYDEFAKSLSEIFLEPSPAPEGKGGSSGPVFRRAFQDDRYAIGDLEYRWAVHNNLKMETTPAELFDLGERLVATTQQRMFETARLVAEKHKLALPWKTPVEAQASTRRVLDLLSRDYPRSDEEMFKAYREKAQAMVAYARDKKMFDLPAEYRLDIVETPEALRDSVDAAYYPAPPFKNVGIGRFYLSPTGGDTGRLKENNMHALADLCAHEGFPGHDWYYQFLRMHNAAVSPIRWLTPGAVEDSSSMWEDSPAAEGWALYAEALMAEPAPGAPDGYYTPEERLYQLQGQLLRDARIRLDTGLHTGKLSFDQAVEYYTANVDFLPAACRAKGDDVRRASCDTAHRAIYRYSKWPTQAITYQLGKQAILDLREEAHKLLGEKFSAKEFHERFMRQGTIPPGYFRDRILHPESR